MSHDGGKESLNEYLRCRGDGEILYRGRVGASRNAKSRTSRKPGIIHIEQQASPTTSWRQRTPMAAGIRPHRLLPHIQRRRSRRYYSQTRRAEHPRTRLHR